MRHRGLYRSRDHVLLGVCGGLAEYFDMEPLMMRIFFFGLQFTFIPVMFLIYLALGLMMKKRPLSLG